MEDLREALKHYNLTGERMESDTKKRKRGTGNIQPRSGRHQARYYIKKQRKYKTFDTEEQCEAFLKETLKY